MKTKNLVIVLISFLAIRTHAIADPTDPGKSIFTMRCAGCHNVNQQLTGPALAGVHERRSIDWIVNFVHSSQTMVKKGDKDAVALFEKFNKIPMPDHPDLTEDNIKSIVEFIKSEAKPVEVNKAPFVKPASLPSNAKPLSINDYGFFGIFLFAVGLLIVTLLVAVKVDSIQRAKNINSL